MDFGIPPAVRRRLIDVVSQEDLGYPFWRGEDPLITAFQERMSNRYGWAPAEGRTRVFTDLIQVLQVMIEAATAPGDGVAIHVPTYPPFLATIARSGRRIVPVSFTDPGPALRQSRMLVLVNPQNPTGHVFTRDELTTLASAADSLGLVVLADEIHADLTYAPFEHIPFGSLLPSRTITATSATKAFNLASIRCAVAHIGPDDVKARLDAAPLDYFGQPSILGRVATLAAWQESDAWLADLMSCLTTNRDTVVKWADTTLGPDACRLPHATYLAWLRSPLAANDIERRAHVKLSDGNEFSEHTSIDTSSFVRLNFATSPGNLQDILTRLDDVLANGTTETLTCADKY
ncbi:pyridoxal phosphate-dependent aminotransferase [Kibdelosporangium aridum]|uniref:cysteine-S-conjugate beta-lyase n=2 Tax=Kibdelosporangium aridum TaxID=2030 RepID=A0A428ZHP5_KIBAR|nr:pyridoxal phosphate-dependent aminotransferase [Kibdelosporangium aridum]